VTSALLAAGAVVAATTNVSRVHGLARGQSSVVFLGSERWAWLQIRSIAKCKLHYIAHRDSRWGNHRFQSARLTGYRTSARNTW
jgi:hypothetical protein